MHRECREHFSLHRGLAIPTCNEPLTRYVKFRVAHAPGMFSPPPRVSDLGVIHGTCVMHVPWCMPESLTSGFLWNRWLDNRYPHYRRMLNPQFYVSGKRPMGNGDLKEQHNGDIPVTLMTCPILFVAKYMGGPFHLIDWAYDVTKCGSHCSRSSKFSLLDRPAISMISTRTSSEKNNNNK